MYWKLLTPIICLSAVLAGLASSCTAGTAEIHSNFRPVVISKDSNLWWARSLGDVNKDGLLDIVLQNNNGHGGWLGWLEARQKGRSWRLHMIAKKSPQGGTFASGDLEGDGDNDIFRLPTHDAEQFKVLINTTKKKSN